MRGAVVAFALVAGCSVLVDTDPSLLGGEPSGCPPEGCDDGIPCTRDACEEGVCVHRPDDTRCGDDARCSPTRGCVPLRCRDDVDCDDLDLCNGVERCGGDGADPVTGCAPGIPFVCDDGIPCTDDRCVTGVGCVHAPLDEACEGGVACAQGRCDPAMGCVFSADHARCDDGRCTMGGMCDLTRGCVGGTEVDCDDRNPCTVDACDPEAGCTHTPVDADGDGFPAMEVDGVACAGGTDCDDSDPLVNPGAVEVCDGRDTSCSGAVDDVPGGCGGGPDTCERATPIVIERGGGRIDGSFDGLTAQYETVCRGLSGDALGSARPSPNVDAVHYFDLPAGIHDVTIDTDGSEGDTVLAVTPDCGDFAFAGLGCNDDVSTSNRWARVWLQRVTVAAAARRFFVLVEPWGTGRTGAYRVNVRVASAQSGGCGSALDVSGGGTVINFGRGDVAIPTTGSCGSTGAIQPPDARYAFSAATRGGLVAQVFSRAFDPLLFARTRCDQPMSEVACSLSTNLGDDLRRASIDLNVAGGTIFVDRLSATEDLPYSLHVWMR